MNAHNSIKDSEIEQVLINMKRLGDAKGKMIVFQIDDYAKGDYIDKFKIIENTDKVLAFATGSDNITKVSNENYTITYHGNNIQNPVKDCGSNIQLAKASIKKYLKGGASKIKITYTPLF
jgi:hypothetical protein